MPLRQRKQLFKLNEHNMVKNPIWQEVDQLATNRAWPRIWTRTTEKQIQLVVGWRSFEGLNPGPPDYNNSTLNHSTTLPPLTCTACRQATWRRSGDSTWDVNGLLLAERHGVHYNVQSYHTWQPEPVNKERWNVSTSVLLFNPNPKKLNHIA